MRVARWKAVAGASALALVVAACGSGGSGGTGSSSGIAAMAKPKGESGDTYTAPKVAQQANGKQIVVTTDQPWFAYNNAEADNVNSYNGYANIMVLSNSFNLDGNNKVLLNKDLMDSVTVTSQKPYTVVWKINPKAVWQDGKPVSCDDFYLTWLADSGKVKSFLPGGTAGYEDMKPPKCGSGGKNSKTVTTTFNKPFLDYKSLFGGIGDLLPAHAIEQQTHLPDITKLTPKSSSSDLKKVSGMWNSKKGGWATETLNKKTMLSDGPYMFSKYQKDQSITLVRNPKWWGNPGGPAKIVLKANKEVGGQVKALQNNDTDLMFSAHPDSSAAEDLRAMTSKGYSYGAAPGLSFEHLDLNFANKWLKDKNVRKAFFQCVDRQELLKKVVQPVDPSAKTYDDLMFFPGQKGYEDNYSKLSTGKAAAAKKTLEADGFKLNKSSGYYTKGGKTLSLRIDHTPIPSRADTVRLIQSQCKKAGIQIKDDSDDKFLEGRVSQGDYDVALFAWSTSPFLTQNLPEYLSAKKGGGENWSKYSNPTVDKDLKQAASVSDASKATQLYVDASKKLAGDYYSLPLFLTPNMWAWKSKTIDRVYVQGYYGPLFDANEWVPGK